MKTPKKNNFKIVAATGMTIFSLLTTFVGVFAWFTSIRKVDNGANQFEVTPVQSVVKKIHVFNQAETKPYVFNSEAAVVYSLNNGVISVESGDINNIKIDPYESLSASPDNTLLYLFELDTSMQNNGEDSLKLNIKTETPDSAEAGANGTKGSLVYRDPENGKVAHPIAFDVSEERKAQMIESNPSLADHPEYFGQNSMSSIIAFDTKSYDSLNPVSGTYDLSADFRDEDEHDSHSFVNQTPNTGESKEITYSYTTNNINIFNREAKASEDIPQYVAVVCHYNVTVIQYIFNLNLGNPAADSSKIIYTCDWYFSIL